MNPIRPFLRFSALTLAAALSLQAQAHDAWPVAQGDGYKVVYGHYDKPEDYAVTKVRQIHAYDAQNRILRTTQRIADGAVYFTVQGKPAVLPLEFDNGYWSKTTQGSVNLPRNAVDGALGAAHVVKFSKTVLHFGAAATTARGQRLEIVPQGGAAPKADGTLTVQVLWDGKPLPDARLMRGHTDEKAVVADARGQASLPIEAGRQVWYVMHRQPLRDDPKADDYAASANLIFQAQ
jgi:nickel transport protein